MLSILRILFNQTNKTVKQAHSLSLIPTSRELRVVKRSGTNQVKDSKPSPIIKARIEVETNEPITLKKIMLRPKPDRSKLVYMTRPD